MRVVRNPNRKWPAVSASTKSYCTAVVRSASRVTISGRCIRRGPGADWPPAASPPAVSTGWEASVDVGEEMRPALSPG